MKWKTLESKELMKGFYKLSRQERLDRVRQICDLSQEELAYQTDTDRTYISDIERGLRNPSLKNSEMRLQQ